MYQYLMKQNSPTLWMLFFKTLSAYMAERDDLQRRLQLSHERELIARVAKIKQAEEAKHRKAILVEIGEYAACLAFGLVMVAILCI